MDLTNAILQVFTVRNAEALQAMSKVFCWLGIPFVILMSFLITRGYKPKKRLWMTVFFSIINLSVIWALIYVAHHWLEDHTYEQHQASQLAAILQNKLPDYHYRATPNLTEVEVSTWKEEPGNSYVGTVRIPNLSDQQTYEFSGAEWQMLLNKAK